MTVNFLRAGQILEDPTGTSSKSISNAIQQPLVTKMKLKKSGPVVRTPVSATLGLNFNPGFFFFLSKALYRIIFSILFRASNPLQAKRIKLNLIFKLLYLSSNLALTLGCLNPDLNPALALM